MLMDVVMKNIVYLYLVYLAYECILRVYIKQTVINISNMHTICKWLTDHLTLKIK